jgi:GNAT superfamily N-acetyltransferase
MIEVEQVGPDWLVEYGRIPIAFEVRAVLRVEPPGSGDLGFRLVEERVPEPYVKDYDNDPDGRVVNWPRRFDVANWGFFAARDGKEAVGAAAVAIRTPGVHMLEGRDDLAVLWDVRIQPARRRQGIGMTLFRHAADWARGKGCCRVKVETQNTNVPACRFYARQGCVLGGINRFAYAACPGVAHETMLLWYLELDSGVCPPAPDESRNYSRSETDD